MTQKQEVPPPFSPKINPRLMNGLKFVAVILLVFGGLLLGARVAVFLMPFTLAFAFAQLLEPLIRFIRRKTPLKRPLISIALCVLFFAALIVLLSFLVSRIVSEGASLVSNFPEIYTNISSQLQNLLNNLREELALVSPEALDVLSDGLNSLYQALWGGLRSLTVKIASASANQLPTAFFSIIVMIVGTVLLTSGRERIFQFLEKQFPESWVKSALNIRDDLLGALWGYIKAQLKIMTVVFIELLIGFSIIGSRYALLIALGIAILDALPVFGAGLILIPSALWGFVTQDYRLGIGCAIMYACTITLRQMLEPKVLSNEIGLHPLVTLLCMYSGFRISGFVGLVFGPIIMLVAKNLISVYMANRSFKELLDGVAAKPNPPAPLQEKKTFWNWRKKN